MKIVQQPTGENLQTQHQVTTMLPKTLRVRDNEPNKQEGFDFQSFLNSNKQAADPNAAPVKAKEASDIHHHDKKKKDHHSNLSKESKEYRERERNERSGNNDWSEKKIYEKKKTTLKKESKEYSEVHYTVVQKPKTLDSKELESQLKTMVADPAIVGVASTPVIQGQSMDLQKFQQEINKSKPEPIADPAILGVGSVPLPDLKQAVSIEQLQKEISHNSASTDASSNNNASVESKLESLQSLATVAQNPLEQLQKQLNIQVLNVPSVADLEKKDKGEQEEAPSK